jgi:hypothetical protein
MGGILWAVIALLVFFWLVGAVLELFGPVLHLLLVVAAVMFVANLFLGSRRRV